MNGVRNEARKSSERYGSLLFCWTGYEVLGWGSAVGVDGFDFCYDGLYVIEGDRQAVGVPREFDEVFRAVDACLAECFRSCKCCHQMVRLPAGCTP